MTISVVIPHRDRGDLLAAVLRSLRKQSFAAEATVEIIVVDNGSTDDSERVAAAGGAKWIALGDNRGVSRALNAGIAAATGERIALLNNDVELAPDWLSRLSAALDDPDVWFASGKTLRFDDERRIDGAGDAVCRGGTAWRLGHGRSDGPWFDAPRKTYFPSATAALFKRGFFEQVGPLEERFFAYLEDVDLGLRAALADLAGRYVPEAVARHRGSATAGVWSDATVRWITRHQILLLAKFYSGVAFWGNLRAILVAQTLWAALAASRGRFGAWAAGMVEGLRETPSLRRDSAAWRGRRDRLQSTLRAAEAEIFEVQRLEGWDSYWKWYSRLTWPAARRRS